MKDEVFKCLEYNDQLLESNLELFGTELEHVTFGNAINSIHWTYGHIVVKRADLFVEVFGNLTLNSTEISVYRKKDSLLTYPDKAISFDELRDLLKKITMQLKQRISKEESYPKFIRILEHLLYEAHYLGQISIISHLLANVELFW